VTSGCRRAWRLVVSIGFLLFAGVATPASASPRDVFVTSLASSGLTRLDGATGELVYANGLGPLAGVALGPDGALYVTILFSDTVERMDPATGAWLGTFASGGGLDTAVGLTFGPDGHLYVASRQSGQVLRYDGSSGAFIDVFASDPELNNPEALAFGPDGISTSPRTTTTACCASIARMERSWGSSPRVRT